MKTNDILLSVVIPAYNVEPYLEKCVYSMLPYEYPESHLIEILIINDGSKDSTLDVARKLASQYKQVTVIDKENGGHGSTINVGIKCAKGKYFRIIDGDDWVDSKNFIKFLQQLQMTDADIVLTDASYEYADSKDLAPYVNYIFQPNMTLNFDEVYQSGGFNKFGPVLASTTYKLENLKKSGFYITEHSAYVDMELNAFSVKNANTLIYYRLDVYRYLIGSVGQTVSKEVWMKKYKEHERIIFNLINFIERDSGLASCKIDYIEEKLIAPMVNSQVYMYDQICKWDELMVFLRTLSNNNTVYTKCMSYIYDLNGDCKLILNKYLERVEQKENNYPIIHIVSPSNAIVENKSFSGIKFIRKIIKMILPYGIVRIYQKKKYGY